MTCFHHFVSEALPALPNIELKGRQSRRRPIQRTGIVLILAALPLAQTNRLLDYIDFHGKSSYSQVCVFKSGVLVSLAAFKEKSTACGCQCSAVGCLIEDTKSKSKKGHNSGVKHFLNCLP